MISFDELSKADQDALVALTQRPSDSSIPDHIDPQHVERLTEVIRG